VSYVPPQQPNVLDSVAHAVKNTDLQKMQLPQSMTTDDFTRAVAVATVSALRHQQTHAQSPAIVRTSGAEHEASGGHDAPSWSRTTSASVLLVCTFLYALIAGKLAMESSLCLIS
jgi:Ca2+:H+ antiporter